MHKYENIMYLGLKRAKIAKCCKTKIIIVLQK